MKRWQIIFVAVIACLGISLAGAYRLGVQKLQSTVIDALGPGSRVTQFKVNWFTIELFGLSIDAPKGWPTARTLESEHVTIVPDLRSLFSDKSASLPSSSRNPICPCCAPRGSWSWFPA